MTHDKTMPLYSALEEIERLRETIEYLSAAIISKDAELRELAERTSIDMLQAYDFKTQTDLVPWDRSQVVRVELRPICANLKFANHPLDRMAMHFREHMLDQLQKNIAKKFSYMVLRDWENAQQRC